MVPAVNLEQNLAADDVNMVTCGGQATIPVVHAISRITDVHYAEIVASIASKSAGPGTRANIDEFTETTSRAIEQVGGAARGKAIIVLNPAEPPLMMRDTVLALIDGGDEFLHQKLRDSIIDAVGQVNNYMSPATASSRRCRSSRSPRASPSTASWATRSSPIR